MKKFREEKFGVSCHGNLWIAGNLINMIELDHFRIRQVGDHYYLRVFKLVKVLCKHFSFVLAVLAVGAENNEDGVFFLLKVIP